MPPTTRLRAVRPPSDAATEQLAVIRVEDLRRVIRVELEEALGQARQQAPVLLDREALARALTVSIPTIDRLRRAGMPTVWIVQAPRFQLDDVIAWLREHQPSE